MNPAFILILMLFLANCASQPERPEPPPEPAILLITLDTTRADRMGWERSNAGTPNLDRLAASGRVFQMAYATAPMTLPAHASLMTGLYPAEHHIHENSRFLSEDLPLVSQTSLAQGYATAAFVSGLPLTRQFGLARGFEHFDDSFKAHFNERTAGETTNAALRWLETQKPEKPLFLWVHYFDPHAPYAAPEPWRQQYPQDPYQAEIAYMDSQLGRLVEAFQAGNRQRPCRILVVGDHGEGLGDHGEAQHGNLIYSSVTRVPLILAGDGISPGSENRPVSTRRVYHTLLDWMGLPQSASLLSDLEEVVLSEALKPWLQFGWAPQIAAVHGNLRVIRAADTQVFEIGTDPLETTDLHASTHIPPVMLQALENYPLPIQAASSDLSQEELSRLASLGYASSSALTSKTEKLPNPRDMVHLFADLDRASDLFVQQQYRQVVPLFKQLLEADPDNPMLCIRLAVACSLLDQNDEALQWFRRAGQIVPESIDLHHYLGMHYFRTGDFDRAAEKFEWVLERMPDKAGAMESLGLIRAGQHRVAEAIALLEKVARRQDQRPDLQRKLGDLYMEQQDSQQATRAFQLALSQDQPGFDRYLELGVCLMDLDRLNDADLMLERVPGNHPGYAMALFKRAQIGVLAAFPDVRERIQAARTSNDPRIIQLIQNEPLFRPYQ